MNPWGLTNPTTPRQERHLFGFRAWQRESYDDEIHNNVFFQIDHLSYLETKTPFTFISKVCQ